MYAGSPDGSVEERTLMSVVSDEEEEELIVGEEREEAGPVL